MCGECVFPSVNSSSRALTDSCCSCHSQTSNLLHWIWASRDQQWLVVVLRYAFAKKKKKKTNLYLTESNSIPCCDWLTIAFERHTWQGHRHVHAAVSVLFNSKTLTLRWLMSYIYGAPILDVSRSHTTTQHSR